MFPQKPFCFPVNSVFIFLNGFRNFHLLLTPFLFALSLYFRKNKKGKKGSVLILRICKKRLEEIQAWKETTKLQKADG